MPTSPLPPLVSLAQLGDMAIAADADLHSKPDPLTVGTIKVALIRLQRIYEADRARTAAQLRIANAGLARLMADVERDNAIIDMYEKG